MMSTKHEIVFNGEMNDAISKIHPSNRDTAINLAVKLFTDTDLYKSFFLMPEHRPKNEDGKGGGESVPLNLSSTPSLELVSNNTKVVEDPEPVVEKKSVTWDSF